MAHIPLVNIGLRNGAGEFGCTTAREGDRRCHDIAQFHRRCDRRQNRDAAIGCLLQPGNERTGYTTRCFGNADGRCRWRCIGVNNRQVKRARSRANQAVIRIGDLYRIGIICVSQAAVGKTPRGAIDDGRPYRNTIAIYNQRLPSSQCGTQRPGDQWRGIISLRTVAKQPLMTTDVIDGTRNNERRGVHIDRITRATLIASSIRGLSDDSRTIGQRCRCNQRPVTIGTHRADRANQCATGHDLNDTAWLCRTINTEAVSVVHHRRSRCHGIEHKTLFGSTSRQHATPRNRRQGRVGAVSTQIGFWNCLG